MDQSSKHREAAQRAYDMKRANSFTPTQVRLRKFEPSDVIYFDTPQAAGYIGVSRQFLEKRRHFGDGPEFIRVTSRCIRYEREALDRWMAARRASAVADYRDKETEAA